MKNSTVSTQMRILGTFLLLMTAFSQVIESATAYELKSVIIQDEMLAKDLLRSPSAMKELVALQTKISKFDEKKRKALLIQTENYLKKFDNTDSASLDAKTADKIFVLNYVLQVLKDEAKDKPVGRKYWLKKINSVSIIPAKWSDALDKVAQKYAENYAKIGNTGNTYSLLDLAKNWYDCKTVGKIAINNYSFAQLSQKIMKEYIIPATSFGYGNKNGYEVLVFGDWCELNHGESKIFKIK